jgi:hypothetical protein
MAGTVAIDARVEARGADLGFIAPIFREKRVMLFEVTAKEF